ncbi:hypothetical protein [Pseudoalteromonas luteoviolacea]|uniref:Chitin-binding type-3 domain-containing protein n=1 Tax=Pseudoalteromonas luteoviolacea DSM 6061 TaxID=1365250 RepID=A0A161XVS5_9GAMM|nr:hypothetical protein [Pseudoalteromonas luteoviolacea]KZN37129.1 hypothetical protein N475_17075 [Pseudoalteromonas luteoviolacea DSM 6061]MBE0389517.1 hypothetical protein [Pseudoalteromonas luteoviolacea DSM 6061]
MKNLSKKALYAAVICGLYNQASAIQTIDENQYQQLMPTYQGAVDYRILLADKVTVNYHCEIIETPDGGYDIDREGCNKPGQFYHINWQEEFPSEVNLSVIGTPSSNTIVEHKLWAIAFAHASASSRIQMQYGLRKGANGTFDLTKPFATGERFGDYFERQMNPNYFVSKGLQESSLGKDLPAGVDEDDGVLQIEYPGSAWAELQGVVGGGFPLPFKNLDPRTVLSSHTGPARNILGSSLSSGFYNGSALAIVSGSLPWNQGSDLSQDSMHLFLQQSKDPDALSMLMSFMYNRGPYAAKDQLLRSQEIFDHCVSITEDLEDDWTCFQKQNDFGARYIRQIPDVTNTLTLAAIQGSTYDSQLSWDDIANYLSLLQNYGFYSKVVIDKAKSASKAVFDNLKSNGTISYQTQFGHVLEQIMVNLPIYELGEGGPYDEQGKKQFYLYNYTDKTALVVANNEAAQADVNEFVLSQNRIAVDINGQFVQLKSSDGAYDCTNEANNALAALKATIDETYVSLSAQLKLTLSENTCSFEHGPHTPPPPVQDGYWDPSKLYNQPGQIVIDALDCHEYKNEWYIVGGNAPSKVFSQDPWGVWRRISERPNSACLSDKNPS